MGNLVRAAGMGDPMHVRAVYPAEEKTPESEVRNLGKFLVEDHMIHN